MTDNDYTKFDSKKYCETFYTTVDLVGNEGVMTSIYDSLSDVFSSGKITGSTLLDFGSGPTIHSFISAAHAIPNVYLSDFCENNRNALWRWQTAHPEAHDFSAYFKYLSKKEDSSVDLWQKRQEEMRRRVKGILSCDMTLSNPLHPAIFPLFDVITSCWCLDVVPSRTVAGYETAVQNVMSLLKPDGWFVLIGQYDCHYYKFADYNKYDCVALTRGEVEGSMQKAGLTIVDLKEYPFTPAPIANYLYTDCTALFCLVAQKRQ